VYETEVELRQRIVHAGETIRQTPETFERTRQSLLRRCQLSLEVRGRHFKQLL
jgi:hypothetical protein